MSRLEIIFARRFKMLLLAFFVWSFVNTASCFFNVYPKIKQISVRGNPGEPLYLTPLIEAGKIKEAQDAARVGPLKGAENITSFSGYLTVNKKFNSNLFFWFFPVEVRNVCHKKF
jgi:vitellogenic carboxypeptidase-like protein